MYFPYYCQVDSEYAAGRIQQAIFASQRAKKLNIIGIVVGAMVNVMAIICIVVAAIVSSSDNDDYDNN